MVSRPRASVIGPGAYFGKIREGLERAFDVLPPLDKDVAGDLARSVGRQRPDAILILSPNAHHARQFAELAAFRIPILVEKPLATTGRDLSMVAGAAAANPYLYCSDFYPDVRALPLMKWYQADSNFLPADLLSLSGDLDLWRNGPHQLGRLVGIQGVLDEGAGSAATFQGRDWLWDSTHGGVLWDLAYHYVVLCMFLMRETLTIESAVGTFHRHPPHDPSGEIASDLRLTSLSGIPIHIHAMKYRQPPANRRLVLLQFERGSARMTFGPINNLKIRAGRKACVAELLGDYYAHVASAFRAYVDRPLPSPYGLIEATSAIEIILRAKRAIFRSQDN